jgi:tetratricopeptide (TPR) repeat protein
MKIFLYILFVFQSILSFSQLESEIKNGIYSDRLTDDFGNPIVDVKIQVKGKGTVAYTNHNGNFSIKANIGDIIVLSKNGEQINSYVLDGRPNYYIEDNSKTFSSNAINYLDSAKIFMKKDPFKSIDYVEKHFKSKKKLSKNDLALGYSILGDNYMFLKQYDLSVSNYLKSLQQSEQTHVQINLAQAFAFADKLNESNHIYSQILNKKVNNSQQIIVNEGLGDNYRAQKLYNKALTHYQTALKNANSAQLQETLTRLNTKIADVMAKLGKSESNVYLENSLKSTENSSIQKRISTQSQVADVYQTNKNYDKEIEVRKQSLAALENAKVEEISIESPTINVSNSISVSQLNLEIGRAYIDKKEYDKALPYLEKSANSAKRNEDLETEKDALQKLSELYKSIGNSQKALEKYQEYAKTVDLLYQQKELEIKAAISMSNDLLEKQNRINSLEKDRALSESQYRLFESEQQLTVSNYKRQKMLIYGLLSGLILLGVAVFAMYRSNQQKKLANNVLALKSLRSQMNPHFIFNALNSVNSFIAQNDERAANRYLTDFSTLMRSVLDNSEQDFISLEKEIELIKLYTQLEHSRFTDKFDYEIRVDSNLNQDQFKIPPMLIQPYVENAVWHGLRYKEDKGHLQIDFTQSDAKTVQIIIVDNGIGRKKSKEIKTQNQKKQESKGMSNIKKRIDILNEMYRDKVKVAISDLTADGSGTKVVVNLKM